MSTRFLAPRLDAAGRRRLRRHADARPRRPGASAQRSSRHLHDGEADGVPSDRHQGLPAGTGAGDRLLRRLLRPLHLPAAVQRGGEPDVSDDAGADLSRRHQAVDRHRDPGLLSRLPLRERRGLRSGEGGDVRVRRDQRRVHAGAAVLRAQRHADRRRPDRRLLPDLPVPVRQGGGRNGRRAVPPEAIARCGCTYPNCQAGEELVCAGVDNCMGPCACRPARGVCKDDSSCAAGEKCDVSACRLPPMTTTTADPMRQVCDPLKCGPQLGLPVGMCPGGGISGPTGRCLLNADGTCGWEVLECAPEPGCYGICVPNIPQTGCQANTDCPMGQMCDVQCREWACTPGGGAPAAARR